MSLVSHGQGAMVRDLLHALAAQADPRVAHVVLTHNIEEAAVDAPAGGWPFEFTELHNARALGFGANHNQAFTRCATPWFCVLNPDIALPDATIWQKLLQAGAGREDVGLAYPRLRNPDGSAQENEREAVTPLALLRRHLLRAGQRRTDWASAALWLVRSTAWRAIGGFDERYFMYCEDTDFCLRLRLAGWRLVAADAHAVHAGSYHSRRSLKALTWHVSSLLRLWTQPPLRLYLAGLAKARQ